MVVLKACGECNRLQRHIYGGHMGGKHFETFAVSSGVYGDIWTGTERSAAERSEGAPLICVKITPLFPSRLLPLSSRSLSSFNCSLPGGSTTLESIVH